MNEPAAKQPAATRVARADLQVAPELAAFVEEEALPGTGVDAGGLLGRALGAGARTRAAQLARCWRGAPNCRPTIDAWHVDGATSRTTARPTRPSSPRSAICCPKATISPSRPPSVDPEIATRAGPAAGRADHQRALRAERGECPLGQPLRRPLRHRRHGQRAAGRRLRPGPRRAGRGAGAGVPRRGLPAGRHQPRRRAALPRARRRAAGRRPAAGRSRRSSSAIAAIRGRRRRSCCATTACMSSWSSTAPIRSAAAIRRGWPTCGWKAPSRRSWTARIRSPASTPRTRSAPIATGSA